MPINLRDIPTAVQDYLNNKVAVTVSQLTPASGPQLGINETFTFTVNARNANAADGGIALKNVRYVLSVDNPNVLKLFVAPTGPSTSPGGNPLAPGTLVGAMIHVPTGAPTAMGLGVGDNDTMTFTGKTGTTGGGVTTEIKAQIIADVDLDSLFPKGENSPVGSRSVTVLG
jgi:hypothetical protein